MIRCQIHLYVEKLTTTEESLSQNSRHFFYPEAPLQLSLTHDQICYQDIIGVNQPLQRVLNGFDQVTYSADTAHPPQRVRA